MAQTALMFLLSVSMTVAFFSTGFADFDQDDALIVAKRSAQPPPAGGHPPPPPAGGPPHPSRGLPPFCQKMPNDPAVQKCCAALKARGPPPPAAAGGRSGRSVPQQPPKGPAACVQCGPKCAPPQQGKPPAPAAGKKV